MNFLANLDILQNAIIAGLLASICCGLVGPLVVVNRISYLAGGMAHTILGGIGIAVYYQLPPLLCALITAILSAIAIAYVRFNHQQHEDSIIGAFWSLGMAVGILFISQTPGYNSELMSYLFGNILIVSDNDIWLMIGLDILVLCSIIVLYRLFVIVSFDSDYALTRGISVPFYYTLLLCLVSLSIVVLIQVVGLILVIALLSIPAVLAMNYANYLPKIMLFSVLFGCVFTMGGMWTAFAFDLPAGATIILFSVLSYLLAFFVLKPLKKHLLI